MYDLPLTTSHVPAQSDMETREITQAQPGAEALVEIRQDGSEGGAVGPTRNCWQRPSG